ncbi:MAG: ParB N-terminal domain-containing protein, partial [Chloroflexota bacterium]
MPKKYDKDKSDILQNLHADPDEVADAGYGKSGTSILVNSGIRARPLPIDLITPDRTQPRQQIPRELRKKWDGKPSSLPPLLDQWAQIAGLSATLVAEIIRGSKSLHDIQGEDAELLSLLKVLDMASSIHDIGLKSPISVIELTSNRYQIVFGERRWLAFQALAHWLQDEQYKKIPAKIENISPWEARKIQSAENNQRDELSAIGKARQFAVLLMDAREQFADASYESLSAFGDEWSYYAQVANGNDHSIPYGMGAEFEAAMGISTGQMRQYRTLLSMYNVPEIDRTLWNLADDNDWSERLLRDIYTYLGASQVQNILRTV